MTESFRDQVSRVIDMSRDSGETWDLSPNDQAALTAILQRMSVLDEQVEASAKLLQQLAAKLEASEQKEQALTDAVREYAKEAHEGRAKLEAAERRAAEMHDTAKELYAEGLKVGMQIGEAKAKGERIP